MVKAPKMSAHLLELGILPGGQTKEQITRVFQDDRRKFEEAIKAAGMSPP
jgi:hypothetical protein